MRTATTTTVAKSQQPRSTTEVKGESDQVPSSEKFGNSNLEGEVGKFEP